MKYKRKAPGTPGAFSLTGLSGYYALIKQSGISIYSLVYSNFQLNN